MLFANGPQGGLSGEDTTGNFNCFSASQIVGPDTIPFTTPLHNHTGGLLIDDSKGDTTPVGGFTLQSQDTGLLAIDPNGIRVPIKFIPVVGPQHFGNTWNARDIIRYQQWPRFAEYTSAFGIIGQNYMWDGTSIVPGAIFMQPPAGPTSDYWGVFGGTISMDGTQLQILRTNIIGRTATRVNPFTPGPMTVNLQYQGPAGLDLYTFVPVSPPNFVTPTADNFDPASKVLLWTSPDTPSTTTYIIPIPSPPAYGDNVYFQVRWDLDTTYIYYDGTTHSIGSPTSPVPLNPFTARLVVRIDYD